MKFKEFCDVNFVSITPLQAHYIGIVDTEISPRCNVRYFKYDPNMRGGGLSTIQCAHAAWILHENPLAIVLYIGQIRETCVQFTNNVVDSFHAPKQRLVTITQQQIYANHNLPKGMKFNFVFSDCDFPQSIIRTMTK